MKKLTRFIVPALLVACFASSCKKDEKSMGPDDPPATSTTTTTTAGTGNMRIRFTNKVDLDTLVFGKTYTNPSGESYTVTKFNYYISNIVLTKSDNSTLKINNLYQIIKQSDDTSRTIKLNSIPAGSYKAITFMLGVDSARNCSGAQTGGLDMGYAADMYWGWNQGYIFLKLEGTSPVATSNYIEFHMGGYGGVYKTQRMFTIDFSTTPATVSKSATPVLNLITNVNQMFETPTSVSFAAYSSIATPGTKEAKMIADNYADMISLGSVKNQ